MGNQFSDKSGSAHGMHVCSNDTKLQSRAVTEHDDETVKKILSIQQHKMEMKENFKIVDKLISGQIGLNDVPIEQLENVYDALRFHLMSINKEIRKLTRVDKFEMAKNAHDILQDNAFPLDASLDKHICCLKEEKELCIHYGKLIKERLHVPSGHY